MGAADLCAISRLGFSSRGYSDLGTLMPSCRDARVLGCGCAVMQACRDEDVP